jgi:hypothetical protein
MNDTWREGARSGDPADKCPKCADGGKIVFGSDFKKFGKQSVRACAQCQRVYVNGDDTGPLAVSG